MLPLTSYAQFTKGLSYRAETGVSFSGGEHNPFWLTANDTRIDQPVVFLFHLLRGEVYRTEVHEGRINAVERFKRQRAIRMVMVQFRKCAAVDMQTFRQLPE